jgi:dihydrofolate reductase
MRALRYNVAMSLDGFIARLDGSYDWIIMDPSIDFDALFAEFDTLVMGRKTFDVVRAMGNEYHAAKMRTIVFSRTLEVSDLPNVTIVREDVPGTVASLKEESGKDVWLFGGGDLFRQLLDTGLVDTIEVALMPVLLGSGIPVIQPGKETSWRLTSSKELPSGILMLSYSARHG